MSMIECGWGRLQRSGRDAAWGRWEAALWTAVACLAVQQLSRRQEGRPARHVGFRVLVIALGRVARRRGD